MKREAKAIAKLSLGFDRVVTSPLLRAKQTAEILAERLGMLDELVEDERLGGRFDIARLGEILAANAGCTSIVLVGHEPSMSVTIGHAIGGANVEMKKAALAGVELPDPRSTSGTLICLLPPKVLTAFGATVEGKPGS